MKCLFTRRLINKAAQPFDPDYYMNVGCGRCYSCLSNRRRSWLFRLGIENLHSYFSLFVTLTYDDDHLPPLLFPLHLKEFLDQINFEFKYYAIGEYGPLTVRPHYHIILFSKSDCLSSLNISRHLESCWSRGFITCSFAYNIRLNYILHYHVRPKEPFPDLLTFHHYSKGLGLQFIYNNDGSYNYQLVSYLNSGGRIIQDLEGNYYVIPRYYTRKLEDLGLIKPLNWSFDNDSEFNKFIIRSNGDKPFYQISDFRFNSLCDSLNFIDDGKLFDFNYQNKYNTQYV